MIMQAYDLNTWEAEAGKLGLQSETLLKNSKMAQWKCLPLMINNLREPLVEKEQLSKLL